jgi:adenine-specific DNA-methyltransferase
MEVAMPGIELVWPNKDRILYKVPQQSEGPNAKPVYYDDPGAPSWPDHRPLRRLSSHGDPDREDPNRLIQGDNLVALQALLDQGMAGKFRCVCIDPPYNTGSAFSHYDDFFENTIWLGLMRDRLRLLLSLTKADGSIWIFADDNQAHYLKIIGDEVFGREQFIADVIWQKRDGPPNDRKVGAIHEHILVWGKQRSGSSKKTDAEQAFNLLPRTEKANAEYKVYPEPDGPDPRGPFRKIDTTANGKGGRFVSSLYYPVTKPYTGEEVYPRQGTCWRHNRDDMRRLQEERRLYWGVKGEAGTPMRKLFLDEVKQGVTVPTIWPDVAYNQHASGEIEALFGQKAAFETPKPEAVLERIVSIASNEGDWVLDSFAGSGTTAAVAYQMNRRWVTIEVGDHARTHCLPRLEKVRMGTAPYRFAAHGGFVFEEVGPPIIERDETLGIERIHPAYTNGEYQKAVCLLTGFKHQPGELVFHGRTSKESARYCHVAERGLMVTPEYLEPIRAAVEAQNHSNGVDTASCVVFATKAASEVMQSDLGSGIEIVRIPAGLRGRQRRR